MKSIKLLTITIAIVLMFSSCTHMVYSPDIMEYNYNMRMKSQDELTAKARVRIFLSEKDVKGDYTVISINSYRPFRVFPFSYRNKMSRKLYQKAVMKAWEQGGNGIIITSAGSSAGLFSVTKSAALYKVINITSWDADTEGPAQYINAIFDATLMNKFANGEVTNAKKADVKRYEISFCDEIAVNIKNATSIDEVEFIKKKILILETYNTSLSKPKSNITKAVEKYKKSLVKVEKKVRKKKGKGN